MLALIFAATQTLAPAWNDWKYGRVIDAGAKKGAVAVVVPPSLFANAQPSLDDVRILADGMKTPFVILVPPRSDAVPWVDARLEDTGYVPKRYAQAVGDFGARETPIDEISVATPEESFAASATVEASDDARTWRIVRTDAPLYDYARDGLPTNLSIPIPPTTARYLRVRIASGRQFTITGLRGAEGSHRARALERYPVIVRHVASSGGMSTYDLAGIEGVPLESLDVTSSTARYARQAEVETFDGTAWQQIAARTVERAPHRMHGTIPFEETQSSRWRLVIDDGDDSPVSNLRIYAFGAQRRIVFDASPGITYLLVYGNPDARAPRFDYAKTHTKTSLEQAPAVPLEAPFVNAAYVPERARGPWTERHEWVLWAALGIAVLAVALGSLSVLRSPSTPDA